VLASSRVSDLYACPFCREMYVKGEVAVCPHCDIAVQPLAELPPSHEAQLLEPEDPTPPEDELLPWTYAGRGRGPLIMLSLVGLGVFFFAPWLHETAPEIQTWSGFRFAQALPWLWAAGVGWFIMLALAISRRTVRQMRGARVAAAFLAAMVLITVAVRLVAAVPTHPLIPIVVAWGWGLYAAGIISAMALFFALRFGGSVEDMPTRQSRPPDETLH